MTSRLLILTRNKGGYQRIKVSAIDIDTGRSHNLLEENGELPAFSRPYHVGEVMEVEYEPAPGLRAPHTEDILVSRAERIPGLLPDIEEIADKYGPVPAGDERALFDGRLSVTGSGSAFINAQNLVNYSASFWRASRPLVKVRFQNKIRYTFVSATSKVSMPYMGLEVDLPPLIPAGTLLRVTLGPWWRPENAPQFEERCYLQLSAFYRGAGNSPAAT